MEEKLRTSPSLLKCVDCNTQGVGCMAVSGFPGKALESAQILFLNLKTVLVKVLYCDTDDCSLM